MPKASKEHQWLQRMVGEWTYEAESEAAPGQAPIRDTGTETVRSLGGMWTVGEARSDAGKSETASIITLGYDSAKGRVVGSFVASMMDNLWIYEGSLDEAGRVLTMDTEGPSFTEEGKTARYRDSIEIVSDDHRVMTSRYQTADGGWHPFMTMHYQRAK